MSIEKTEAIVLRAVNFRDTSKVVTFYTRRYGKMSAVAKGARNPKSKFGSLFQPMNFLQIVFYRRENRGMQYVSSSDFVKYFKTLTSDMRKFSIAMSLVEIIDRVMHDEEENESVFELLVDSLTLLDTAGVNPQNVFVHFALHLAINLGFAPNFENCLICGKRIDLEGESGISYVVSKGSPSCQSCSSRFPEEYTLSGQALRTLSEFVGLSPASAAKAVIGIELLNELSNFVFVYLKRHSDNLREIRSLKFLAASMSGNDRKA